MKSKIDPQIATDFITALTTMITAQGSDLFPNPRKVVFTFAAADEVHGFEQLSRDEGMDIVCLVFAVGQEREGPTNIAIYEERNGELTTWPKCSPWAFSREGPCVLLAGGRDVGFAYTSTSMVLVRRVPQAKKAKRLANGKKLLRLMSQCIPPHIRARIVRG